jgi:hypothetical protein
MRLKVVSLSLTLVQKIWGLTGLPEVVDAGSTSTCFGQHTIACTI